VDELVSGIDHTLVWLDGKVLTGAEATVSVLDHGFTVGDGVFETLKVVHGTPFALDRHLLRLRASADGLGLAAPADDDVRAACAGVLAAWSTRATDRGDDWPDGACARLRITLTSGTGPAGSGRGTRRPTLVVTMAPLVPAEPATTVVTVPWRRNEHAATVGVKTTSYADNVMALAAAQAAGATEALMANTAGNLCEGTGSNVFVVIDNQLLTPPLSSGCLAGVTRALVLESGCGVVQRDIAFDALGDASEIFLTSTTRDVQAVTAVDGRLLPEVPGPHTARAIDAFAVIARQC
jgi:branched-chain amino acid aminotransferase